MAGTATAAFPCVLAVAPGGPLGSDGRRVTGGGPNSTAEAAGGVLAGMDLHARASERRRLKVSGVKQS